MNEHPMLMLSKSETFFQTLLRKLKSHRVIWCYIYLVLYVWMSVYAILKYANAVNTIIVTTGGMVTMIFSAYILGTSYENVNYGKQMTTVIPTTGDVDQSTDER